MKLGLSLVLIAFCASVQISIAQHIMPPFQGYGGVNYIQTWNATSPQNDPAVLITKALKDVKLTTQFMDGLGRPVQTVLRQGSQISGSSSVDWVIPIEYDEFGREQYKYLPFAANNISGIIGNPTGTTDGAFKYRAFQQDSIFNKSVFNNESYFYTKVDFEESPLNRSTRTMAPGNNWVGASRGITEKYFLNTVADSVRIWYVSDIANSFGTYATTTKYSAGQLSKSIIIDENGKQVIEFKDKNDKTILKKIQLTALPDSGAGRDHSGWICTYYLYDDLNELRAVIQPKGVELLRANGWNVNYGSGIIINEQMFRFEYDSRQRLIEKKIPGAGPVWMVYDARDRLVLSQDSVNRGTSWQYIKYDSLNRAIASGVWINSSNYSFHASRADTSIGYPNLSGETFTEWTNTFYDDYSWRSNYSNPLSAVRDGSNDSYFLTASNSTWPYPQTAYQSKQLKGMVTGTRIHTNTNISDFEIFNVNFYDDKGRLIQKQSNNITEGTDVASYQFGWSGQPLITIQKHQRSDVSPSETTTIVTKMTYDDLSRLVKIEKRIGSTLVDGNAMSAYHTISELEYNALGQLKFKKLGKKKDVEGAYTTTPIETLSYAYNIRGWPLGVNKEYIADQGTARFGFELAYDKRTSVFDNYSANTYTKSRYDGSVAGTIWRSIGDGEIRKYDFDYDGADRLIKGDFSQRNAGWNVTAGTDFSMYLGDGIHADSAYDLNGNILKMVQKGLRLNQSYTIDDLRYTYQAGSNKLIELVDIENDEDSKLGDFRDIENPEALPSDDYTYDGNGNLTRDRNKDITFITYNHLNLPTRFAVDLTTNTGWGDVYYYYDGIGNKIEKKVFDAINSSRTTTVTRYISGFVYEGIGGEGGPSAEDYKLRYLSQEEGQIRFKPGDEGEGIPAKFEFDYFIKDHLDNVRMVLTEEQQTDAYIPASFETDNLELENLFYSGLDSGRVNRSTVSGYPSDDDYTDPNDFIQKLEGNGQIGANKTLKVMVGDKVSIRTSSWYDLPSNTDPTITYDFGTQLITALSGGIGNLTSTHGGPSVEQIGNLSDIHSGALNFFFDQMVGLHTERPAAFVNWLLFDEQFKYDSAGSGFEQVGPDEEFTEHVISEIPIRKSGYLFVFVSNQAGDFPVYFDNLQVTHIRGPILEETHYYPFGSTMAGLNYKAFNFGDPLSKMKYNRKEEQRNEFFGGYGLELLDYGARGYDPQIGRWNSVDPKSEEFFSLTPYNYAGNNPVSAVDLNGNLFIFASGFMLNQWIAGSEPKIIPQCMVCPRSIANPSYSPYLPDRSFYKDGPHNDGKKFDYWEGVDAAYMTAYPDKVENTYYTNGSFTPHAEADVRFREGEKAGQELISKLDNGIITLQKGETIKIVGHSQGGAYAAGIATALSKNAKYGGLIEFVDYLSPHQPGDFSSPEGIKSRQYSTASDEVSSQGGSFVGFLMDVFNISGHSKFAKIKNSELHFRAKEKSGMGGHMVDTWLEYLRKYFQSQGLKVTYNP
jgi:RHS repeat-associated protein